MKSLFFLFFGTVFHRGLAEFYCVFSRCERLNFDQFPGRDLIVLCAFCVVLGSAVSPPDASRASDRKDRAHPSYGRRLLRAWPKARWATAPSDVHGGVPECPENAHGWEIIRACPCPDNFP